MENNKTNNESLTNEELNDLNCQFQLLIINDAEEEWSTFEKGLSHLKSKGFAFKNSETIMVADFNAESYFRNDLLRMIRERKNELVKSQLYHKVGDLRQIEKKLEALNEKANLLHAKLFTVEGKTIFYNKPDNVFIEALIIIHLGSILTF